MKPEVIFVDVKDGKVTMSREDVERLMDMAYEAGKKDASPLQMPPSYPYVVNPTTGGIDIWMNTSTARSAGDMETTTTTTRRRTT